MFFHVAIHWKIDPQQKLGGIAYRRWCCKKGRISIQNWKTAHFWSMYNVWVDTSNNNNGQHERKWGWGIKWKNHVRKFIEEFLEEIIEE